MRHVTGRCVVPGPRAPWHRAPQAARLFHSTVLVAPRTRRKAASRLCSLEDKGDVDTDTDTDTDRMLGASTAEPASSAETAGAADPTPVGAVPPEESAAPVGVAPVEQFKFSNLLAEMVRAFNDNAPKAPWKLDTVFTVMFMWILSFWIAAYNVVPSVLAFIKYSIFAPQGVTLSYSAEAALRHLLLDVSQMVVITVLLQRALRSYAYREFFTIRPKRKSSKKTALSWIAIGFGVATFPAVDWLHKTMVTLFSGGGQFVRAASNASMFDGDGVYTKLIWFVVLGVAAPVWEEAMFRGFLLPSLARVTSPAMAVVVTSLLFSLVHFTREGFLPLMILGTIFGISYCVTRGLFTSIVLHGLWNVCLLAQVMWKGGL